VVIKEHFNFYSSTCTFTQVRVSSILNISGYTHNYTNFAHFCPITYIPYRTVYFIVNNTDKVDGS